MTPVNTNGFYEAYSGFSPPISHFLSTDPSTRPIFLSIVVILKVYPVLVLILGSIGNLLSFFVLIRANMRRYSTFCYLACLALVDIGVIITFCFNFIALYHFNNDIQKIPIACKLFAFCIYFLPQYSSWILVAVSIDRVISAKYIRLAKTWSKPRNSVLVTFLLGLFLGILNSHFFLYENQSVTSTNNQSKNDTFTTISTVIPGKSDDLYVFNDFPGLTGFSDAPFAVNRDTTLQPFLNVELPNRDRKEYLNFDVNVIHCSLENSPGHANLHVYWVVIDLLVNVFLPFTGKNKHEKTTTEQYEKETNTSLIYFTILAMIACTIIIIFTLVRSSTRSGSTSARGSRRRRNISVMLITVNLVFISLTAPIVIFLIIQPATASQDITPRQQTVSILIKIFCIILMNLNHSVNIIVYSVTGKEFRTETANFLQSVVHCLIGRPANPHDFLQNERSLFSRLNQFQRIIFRCCRMKFSSNSSNVTESSGAQHTTASAANNHRTSNPNNNAAGRTKPGNQRTSDPNGRRKSSIVCFMESTGRRQTSQRLKVQVHNEPVSSICDREDLSLHRLSNSTEDQDRLE